MRPLTCANVVALRTAQRACRGSVHSYCARVPTSDPTVRLLAHPLRTRLLAELRAGGPSTATRLAAALQTNTGATSYHLRRLESVGLVSDTGAGTGKERVWEASEAATVGPARNADSDPDTRAALSWIERDYVRHVAGKADAWLDVAPTWPTAWTAELGLRDHVVLVGAPAASVPCRPRSPRWSRGTGGWDRATPTRSGLPCTRSRIRWTSPHRARVRRRSGFA